MLPQLIGEDPVVVNLTIENDDQPILFKRLVGGSGQIDYRESSVTERNAPARTFRGERSGGIRPAMRDPIQQVWQ
jgi:hypothetical protein